MWRSSPPVRLWTGTGTDKTLKRLTAKIGRRHEKSSAFGGSDARALVPFNDKLSRSK